VLAPIFRTSSNSSGFRSPRVPHGGGQSVGRISSAAFSHSQVRFRTTAFDLGALRGGCAPVADLEQECRLRHLERRGPFRRAIAQCARTTLIATWVVTMCTSSASSPDAAMMDEAGVHRDSVCRTSRRGWRRRLRPRPRELSRTRTGSPGSVHVHGRPGHSRAAGRSNRSRRPACSLGLREPAANGPRICSGFPTSDVCARETPCENIDAVARRNCRVCRRDLSVFLGFLDDTLGRTRF